MPSVIPTPRLDRRWFVLAVLVLTLGLWDTLVIAFFVLIGAVIGQIRDGENGIVNFFGRLFSGR